MTPTESEALRFLALAAAGTPATDGRLLLDESGLSWWHPEPEQAQDFATLERLGYAISNTGEINFDKGGYESGEVVTTYRLSERGATLTAELYPPCLRCGHIHFADACGLIDLSKRDVITGTAVICRCGEPGTETMPGPELGGTYRFD